MQPPADKPVDNEQLKTDLLYLFMVQLSLLAQAQCDPITDDTMRVTYPSGTILELKVIAVATDHNDQPII